MAAISHGDLVGHGGTLALVAAAAPRVSVCLPHAVSPSPIHCPRVLCVGARSVSSRRCRRARRWSARTGWRRAAIWTWICACWGRTERLCTRGSERRTAASSSRRRRRVRRQHARRGEEEEQGQCAARGCQLDGAPMDRRHEAQRTQLFVRCFSRVGWLAGHRHAHSLSRQSHVDRQRQDRQLPSVRQTNSRCRRGAHLLVAAPG